MRPGVYPGIDAGTYHGWPCVSSSRLRKLRVSPAHARVHTATTPTMDLGTLAHVAVLEDARFDRTYTVAGPCVALTKSGDRCTNGGKARIDGEWFCGVHAKGQPDLCQPISADDHAACLGIRARVIAHPDAYRLLGRDRELSVVWTDEDTGLLCKARLDLYGLGRLADLKTTKSARPRDFMFDAFRRGYHIQLAMYEAGAKANGLDVEECWIIAAENGEPYAVNAFRLTEGLMDLGRTEYRRLLDLWGACERFNSWPLESVDYPGTALELAAPDYAYEPEEVA